MQAIVIREHGGPDVLRLEDVPVPEPAGADVRVRHVAIGVNFVDTQHRVGEPYPVELPLIPGVEGAGVVDAVGPDVQALAVGDRVGYAGHMGGDYAAYTLVPEARLVPVPPAVTFEQAAASLMQGMTAHAMATSVHAIEAGETVVVHAATSGVGQFLVQLAKRRDATVIATVSSPAKADPAAAFGADHVIVLSTTDFEAETLRLTGGDGVHVVYDSLGRPTFDQGLRVLRARGHMVVYGLSAGPVPPLDINRLSGITGYPERGSLSVTWATLSDHASRREDLLWHARALFDGIAAGELQVPIARTYPLAEAAAAHRLMEERTTVGKILLIP
jgi:NADPH2:quinone reductase